MKNANDCWHLNIYEHDKFHAHLIELSMQKVGWVIFVFIMLINVKTPTNVCILTFMSMINFMLI